MNAIHVLSLLVSKLLERTELGLSDIFCGFNCQVGMHVLLISDVRIHSRVAFFKLLNFALRLPHECLISRVSCLSSSWAISANYTRHVQPLSDFVDLVLSPVFSKPGLGVDLFVEHVVDPLLHEFLLSLGLAIDSDHQLI